MTTTKSLLVAALLSSIAAVSFAQAPDASMSKGTPSASITNTVQHKKHRHHHHHHAHRTAEAKGASAGK